MRRFAHLQSLKDRNLILPERYCTLIHELMDELFSEDILSKNRWLPDLNIDNAYGWVDPDQNAIYISSEVAEEGKFRFVVTSNRCFMGVFTQKIQSVHMTEPDLVVAITNALYFVKAR